MAHPLRKVTRGGFDAKVELGAPDVGRRARDGETSPLSQSRVNTYRREETLSTNPTRPHMVIRNDPP
jgi:hypothetical protein